jgi:hypothetical protein
MGYDSLPRKWKLETGKWKLETGNWKVENAGGEPRLSIF